MYVLIYRQRQQAQKQDREKTELVTQVDISLVLYSLDTLDDNKLKFILWKIFTCYPSPSDSILLLFTSTCCFLRSSSEIESRSFAKISAKPSQKERKIIQCGVKLFFIIENKECGKGGNNTML